MKNVTKIEVFSLWGLYWLIWVGWIRIHRSYNIFLNKSHWIFRFLLLMAWILNNGHSSSTPLSTEGATIHLRLKRINQNVRDKMFSNYNVSFILVKFNRSKKPGPVCSGILSILCSFPFWQNGHMEISWPVSSNMSSFTDLFDSFSGMLSCSRIFRHFSRSFFLQRFARNPECRIRISFFGRAWRRNRRINSLALRGIDFFSLSFLRSL